MNHKRMESLTSPAEVPQEMTEDEARAFWDTHEITGEYLRKAGRVVEDGLPPMRSASKHIALRIHPDVLERVKTIARKKGKGYQTVLKEFILERLREEEKRAGLGRR
jgi:predicted DNA binding CopG/RHH family protein